MRHTARIKKRPKLNSFTKNKLLHSKNNINHSKSTYFYKQRWFQYSIPLASTLGLLLVMGLCINPLVPHVNEAYATNSAPAGTVSLIMNSNDAVDQSTNAIADTTAYRYNRFTVGIGADISRYQITVQAASGYDSKLVGRSTGQIVNAVSGSKTGEELSGEWGYSLSEGGVTTEASLAGLTYKALPGNGSTAVEYASTIAEDKEFTLAFAANIPTGKPADHYQTSVLLSVAAGANEVSSLNSLTYMQDMTSTACKLASENETAQLIDKRDGKKYWIARLKDGNCWMTQNLDLDISADGLTAALSDMDTDWNSSSTYKPVATKTVLEGWAVGSGTAEVDTVQSYDPGNYYYTTPTVRNNCGSDTNGVKSLSSCTTRGWKLDVTTNTEINGLIDIFDWTPTTDPGFVSAVTYTGTDGISTCTKEAGSLFGDGAYSQCRIYYNTGGDYSKAYEHYHVGNYYSWITATAGAGTSSTALNSVVEQSICPKGWKLPTGLSGGNFYKIFGGLSIADVTSSPYYLVLSGRVWYSTSNNRIDGAGYEIGYWGSSKANSSSSAAQLIIRTNNIDTTSSNPSSMGSSVRCVAR